MSGRSRCRASAAALALALGAWACSTDAGGQPPTGQSTVHPPDPAATAAAECGLSDDLLRPLPAGVVPPPRGQSYKDPVFGCTIRRLTDAAAEGIGSVKHAYSSVNPFNASSTWVLLEREGGRMQVRDLDGNVVRDNLNTVGILPTSEAFWSRTDPNLLYFHTAGGNQLRSFDVATGATATLHTFGRYGRISFGLGEGDISADGNHLPVVGDDRWGFVFTIGSRASSKAVDLGGFAAVLDNADLTPQNRFTLVHDSPGGTELFDRSMDFLGRVLDYQGHSDRGSDTDGSDIIVITNSDDGSPIPGCPNGIVKARLPEGVEQCLRPLDWALAVHISCNNVGQDWCLVSTYDSSGAWPAYKNELLKVRLDGSQTVRLAHSRSTSGSYDRQPRAAVSPDGRYALFDSDMQGPAVDVYLLAIPRGWPKAEAAGSFGAAAAPARGLGRWRQKVAGWLGRGPSH